MGSMLGCIMHKRNGISEEGRIRLQEAPQYIFVQGETMNIKIKDLSKMYAKEQWAIEKMNLSISKGMFGLLGPNGAGKSTLMQILATLLPATEGEVYFGDLRLGKDDHEIRRMLGYLPQEFGLYQKLTGEEFLHYIAMIKGMRDYTSRKLQVDELLERVNLTDKRKAKIKTYSGGMKQRIGIAQALLGKPNVIIVDEPTSGLDPEERNRFRNFLGEISEDRIVLLSTHIVGDIESSCSNLAIMKSGHILYQGNPDDLLARYKGMVWTGYISDRDIIRYSEQGTVVNKRKTKDGYEVRVISEKKPFEEAFVSSVGLEDAYILLVGGTTHV